MNRSRGTPSQPSFPQQMYNPHPTMNHRTAAETSSQPSLLLPCLSCKQFCTKANVGSCIDCYEEATETKQVLKKQIEELKSKVSFLTFPSSSSIESHERIPSIGFTDVVLVPIDDIQSNPPPLPAHKAVLASRSCDEPTT